MNLKGYSQTKQLIEGDTTICFDIEQTKILLKHEYQLKEAKELNFNYLIQIKVQDQVIDNDSIVIENKNKIIGYQEASITDMKLTIKQQEIVAEKREKRARLWRGLAAGLALVSITEFGLLYFK